MGHERIGFLPHTRQWNHIVEGLSQFGMGEVSAASIANSTLEAVRKTYAQMPYDDSVVKALTFLATLSFSAKQEDQISFLNYNNYCAVDILRKTETGYDFYEVKNAPAVYPQFIKDAGFQYYIIARRKVKIGKIYIVIHGPDEDDPFVPVDVTEEAKSYYKWINDHIWDLNRMQKQPEEVASEPGDQCSNPYECWYYGYCHGDQG